jgi:hypothetical protein
MPWWVKALGALTAILVLAAFGLLAAAAGPPVDRSLERVAAAVGAAGFLFGSYFLRAVWSWERVKFWSRAWWTGRQEARRRYRARHRRRLADDDDDD